MRMLLCPTMPAALTSSNNTRRPLGAMISRFFAAACSALMLSSRGRNRAGMLGRGRTRFLTVICTVSACADCTDMRPTSSGQKFTRAEPFRTTVSVNSWPMSTRSALKPPAMVPRTLSIFSVIDRPIFSGSRATAKRRPASV
jgi:hypothetical protein